MFIIQKLLKINVSQRKCYNVLGSQDVDPCWCYALLAPEDNILSPSTWVYRGGFRSRQAWLLFALVTSLSHHPSNMHHVYIWGAFDKLLMGAKSNLWQANLEGRLSFIHIHIHINNIPDRTWVQFLPSGKKATGLSPTWAWGRSRGISRPLSSQQGT